MFSFNLYVITKTLCNMSQEVLQIQNSTASLILAYTILIMRKKDNCCFITSLRTGKRVKKE